MDHTKGSSLQWLFVLAVGSVFLIASCASIQKGYHRYMMRGSIVDVSGSDLYLCIGSKDGAAVGQELEVYEIKQKAKNLYQRQLKGKVKITEIIDEHFAKAKVISGTVDKNDIVELIPPEKS